MENEINAVERLLKIKARVLLSGDCDAEDIHFLTDSLVGEDNFFAIIAASHIVSAYPHACVQHLFQKALAVLGMALSSKHEFSAYVELCIVEALCPLPARLYPAGSDSIVGFVKRAIENIENNKQDLRVLIWIIAPLGRTNNEARDLLLKLRGHEDPAIATEATKALSRSYSE